MTDHRSPPPPAEACLCRPYPSSQKGGTVIAEQVLDIATHERLLRNSGYRPAGCLRCGGTMHIHEYRERVLAGDPAQSTEIALFRCADREKCGAVTRVLPAFIARRLWRSWPTVEEATEESDGKERPTSEVVPERTSRRWRARLAASAAAIVVVLAVAADALPSLREVVSNVGLDGTRAELVIQYAKSTARQVGSGEKLAAVSAVVHRLAPGMRLM